METFDILKSYDWGFVWETIESVEGYFPYVLECNDDKIFIFYVKESPDTSEGTKWDIYFKKSYDLGDTWEEEELAIEDVLFGCVSAIQLHDNVIILAFWQDDEGENKSMISRSYDDGVTWETPVEIGGESTV